ncbi:MAG TPA: hypothetical protein VGJ87_13460 [Roseiflexaceae bacterium]|jgi:hypothetical protein
MTLFSILPQILFSPLASPGAPIYAEVLLQIFAETRRHQQPLSRELALALVHEVLAEPHNTLEMTDDAGDGDTIAEGDDPLTARAGSAAGAR